MFNKLLISFMLLSSVNVNAEETVTFDYKQFKKKNYGYYVCLKESNDCTTEEYYSSELREDYCKNKNCQPFEKWGDITLRVNIIGI